MTAKLDGSLSSPVLLSTYTNTPPVLVWALRRVQSADIESFVARERGADFAAFAREWLANDWTPLFEWCEAKKAVGVITHECDSLTLLAMRHTITGEYMPRGELELAASRFQVPLVPIVALPEGVSAASAPDDGIVNAEADIDGVVNAEAATVFQLQQYVASLDNCEGVVLLAEHGDEQEMYKVRHHTASHRITPYHTTTHHNAPHGTAWHHCNAPHRTAH